MFKFDKIKPKPCPFCGLEMVEHIIDDYHGSKDIYHPLTICILSGLQANVKDWNKRSKHVQFR